MTAAIGVGGGTMMLAALATVLPGMEIVPVHSTVQLGSNAGRALLARAHIDWRRTGWIILGAVVGTLAAAPLVMYVLTPRMLEGLIGVFILINLWMPLPSLGKRIKHSAPFFGLIVSFIGVFVSAVGPLVSSYLKRDALPRLPLVATMAATLVGINLLRLTMFSVTGFDWSAWIALILILVAAGFAGTRVGLMLLGRMPERLFQRILQLLLTLIGLRLLWSALL